MAIANSATRKMPEPDRLMSRFLTFRRYPIPWFAIRERPIVNEELLGAYAE
jgi:hypothetical protein